MLDVLIKNGVIVDGTGETKPYPANIGVIGDRIVEVGPMVGAQGNQVIDANGAYISPGFIDIHSHNDWYMPDQDAVQRFGSFLQQGVTTCIAGNCGWTMAPCLPETKSRLISTFLSMNVTVDRYPWNTMAEFMEYVEKQGLLLNTGQLVGHGAIRIAVMGDECRFCTPDELDQMKKLLRQSMDAGCFGFSTGLMYYPGMYAHTDELVELVKVIKSYGGRYATHLRGYMTTAGMAVEEALTVAQKADVPLQISHFVITPFLDRAADLMYYASSLIEMFHRFIRLPGLPSAERDRLIGLIQNHVDKGNDAAFDVVPYTIGNTTISALYPPSALKGGVSMLLQKLRDPLEKAKIRHQIETTVPKWPHWEDESWSDPFIKALGWHTIWILGVKSEQNRWTEGKTFLEIGKTWDLDAFEAMARLTLEEKGQVIFAYGYPSRPWMEKIYDGLLNHPLVTFGADSVLPSIGTPPASAYGAFPRILGHFCREMKLFSIEEAVHKITGLSAKRYGLVNRGEIKPNAFADLVIFDPKTVNEKYDEKGKPAPPDGIRHVLVNGVQMIEDGALRNAELRPGRMLRKH